MAKKRNTGAFVAGSLLGGLVGAAITLWKTPTSGAELRSSLSGGGEPRTLSTTEPAEPGEERRFSNPVLSFIEKAAAPIAGVELGKLARDDPNAATAAPVRSSAADARPPESSFDPREPEPGTATATSETLETERGERVQPVTGEPLTAPTGEEAPGQAAVNPDEEDTHNPEAGSEAPAASTEDLTHPTPEYLEELEEERRDARVDEGSADFPEPPSR